MKSNLFILIMIICFFSACKKEDNTTVDNTNNNNTNNPTSNILFNPNLTYGTMTDQEGNSYKTIQIGTQTWMAENLRTTKYNDGTSISSFTDASSWSTLTTGAYCNVNHNASSDSVLLNGRLYNWYAVSTGKLAPSGWHIPTYAELTILINYLGGATTAGGKMKETGTSHWKPDNTGASNESGFTALPTGYLNSLGAFQSVGMGSYFWCNDSYGSMTSWDMYLFYNTAELFRNSNYKQNGFSIRCIKD